MGKGKDKDKDKPDPKPSPPTPPPPRPPAVKKNACPYCSGTRKIQDTAGNEWPCGKCGGSGQAS